MANMAAAVRCLGRGKARRCVGLGEKTSGAVGVSCCPECKPDSYARVCTGGRKSLLLFWAQSSPEGHYCGKATFSAVSLLWSRPPWEWEGRRMCLHTPPAAPTEAVPIPVVQVQVPGEKGVGYANFPLAPGTRAFALAVAFRLCSGRRLPPSLQPELPSAFALALLPSCSSLHLPPLPHHSSHPVPPTPCLCVCTVQRPGAARAGRKACVVAMATTQASWPGRLHLCCVNLYIPFLLAVDATIFVMESEKKTRKGTTKEKASNEKKEDDIEKIKSIPFMEGEPEDDVYLKRLYPRQIYEVEKAIHLLKKFQILDFTYPKQGVYLDLTLDMALGKKKKVEPFASVVSLPYPFASEINKVAVFTANASEIKIAEEHGAAFAGGTNLIQKGVAWNMTGVSDTVLAAGGSGGAAGPVGPDESGTVTGWWNRHPGPGPTSPGPATAIGDRGAGGLSLSWTTAAGTGARDRGAGGLSLSWTTATGTGARDCGAGVWVPRESPETGFQSDRELVSLRVEEKPRAQSPAASLIRAPPYLSFSAVPYTLSLFAVELGACPLVHQAFQKPPARRRLLKGLVPEQTGTQSPTFDGLRPLRGATLLRGAAADTWLPCC
ncbi:LOW QUALITY PROTEIN: hypothetical protein QTO34_008265 [Cnephaeus nilssonii]|uniref:Uncharacterized protein n=1 Tax=Cnephaeus nilssonii TaxID=3371016 RepID=A0AA40IB93_CNENI|nr:LOW QUALITY PROTEIN: hypothetical protein QTO34_008265 [Eptesicus nilssonii]